MAEQGKADMEEQIKNLEEEKRQLEQQVCACVYLCVCVCVCVCMYVFVCMCVYVFDLKTLDCGSWEKKFMCHQLPLEKSFGIRYT